MTLTISFEVFPPKTSDGLQALTDTARRLDAVTPAFVSVTYGAGGSDRERSFEAMRAVRAAGSTSIAGHLTCVGQSKRDVLAVIERFQELGVDHVVALRGDPPGGIDAAYEPHPDGYRSTAELVAAIKSSGDVTVSVSAYPERHPQSPTDTHDLDVLAAKIDAGADQAMTQMFFDNDRYFEYRDRVRARGIDVPIVPGIFPIHSFPAVARFAQRCGATIPQRIVDRFSGLDDDLATTHEVAADLAAEQINELRVHGADAVHIYTLNRSELALSVCRRLELVSA
ncbi:MAG: methylenetetrahydrofolate reductase [NAD(P)H] [Ilumatobacteraceae bacterium]